MVQVKSATKTSQAYRRIRGLIEEGRLEAGERVTEAKVSKLVGMSRGPVRESLLRLEAEGLLKNRGNRRSRVVAYVEDQNPEEILQRYELREQIESRRGASGVKNTTGWQIDRLMELASESIRHGTQKTANPATRRWASFINSCWPTAAIRCSLRFGRRIAWRLSAAIAPIGGHAPGRHTRR